MPMAIMVFLVPSTSNVKNVFHEHQQQEFTAYKTVIFIVTTPVSTSPKISNGTSLVLLHFIYHFF